MRKPPRSDQLRNANGRKNLPRDNTKLKIAKYLYSKGIGEAASLYELLHHSGISMYDYPYLKKILQEMIGYGWITVMISGIKGREKLNYFLIERGRKAVLTIKNLDNDNPLLDLDSFYDV